MAPYDADENIQSSFIVDSFICAVIMDFCPQIIKAGLNFQPWKLICLFYWVIGQQLHFDRPYSKRCRF
jgi:hypothetical protein